MVYLVFVSREAFLFDSLIKNQSRSNSQVYDWIRNESLKDTNKEQLSAIFNSLLSHCVLLSSKHADHFSIRLLNNRNIKRNLLYSLKRLWQMSNKRSCTSPCGSYHHTDLERSGLKVLRSCCEINIWWIHLFKIWINKRKKKRNEGSLHVLCIRRLDSGPCVSRRQGASMG